MGVNGMLTAGEVLLQWRLLRGFNFRLMDYPLGNCIMLTLKRYFGKKGNSISPVFPCDHL